MLKRINQISLLVFLLILSVSSSCDKDDEEVVIEPTPTFIVENNEESMPVWVHGNNDADYLILAVHGGPGSDVLDFRTYQGGTGFRTIEQDYLVAYWQQRASGQSAGSNDNELFTIEQYVSDTDKVIDELKSRYPNKEIILFGHSWGGMLTSSYLKEENRRAKVKAWINAAGAHNGTILFSTSKDDIIQEADNRIQANENVAYWEDIKQQLANDPNKTNSLAYDVLENIPEVTIKVDNDDFETTQRANRSNSELFDQIISTNNTSAMADFTLPILILWGEYDYAVSKTLRDEAISNIASSQVTNVLFDASGHYMMFHEPDVFANSMKNFIESL